MMVAEGRDIRTWLTCLLTLWGLQCFDCIVFPLVTLDHVLQNKFPPDHFVKNDSLSGVGKYFL